ncbi:hypothetical protein BKA65DRAFT_552389 [Rhexocercosporidium sp. MPI-PUGE-AT-0058]|nr:hypothetical protein BKA65DRAFT_552389 [Rhexocercosporidium sp. MPI-PUGE-AT-0058]
MRFSIASPLRGDVYITEKLVYLDLASGVEDKTTNNPRFLSKNYPATVNYLDLALHRNTILVPNGQIKMFNKMILKYKGCSDQFVLFPNLPKEIQSDIFKFCSDMEPRMIPFVEMENNGHRSIQRVGAKRPNIFAASKPAFLNALALKTYTPMFATIDNKNMAYFRVGHDWVSLGCQLRSSCPKLELADALVNKLDIKVIETLHLSYTDLFHGYQWGATNLVFLPNIKTLHVTAVFFDPGRAERGVYTLSFKEVYGDRNAFMQFCHTPEGDEVECQDALDTFDDYISHPAEKSRIHHINAHMNHCLNYVPNFPSEVLFIIEYLPVLGYPLASTQPLIQST